MPGEEITIHAADGRPLAATCFDAAPGSGPALLISPAMAVRRAFYASFAARMASEGIPTLTYDYRGIGGSRQGSLRREPATLTDWATLDMGAAIRAARAAFPARPLVMMGHSAGGWMSGMCPEARSLDGLLLVAAQDGHWRHWSPRERARLWLIWHIAIPSATGILGYLPGRLGLGQDVPKAAARQWAAYARRRTFVDGDARYDDLTMPVTALRISDDDYAPKAAVEALVARFTGTRVAMRVIEPAEVGRPVGHFALFREDVGGPLWKEMAGTIRACR